MPKLSSSKKRLRQAGKAAERNKPVRTRFRSTLKQVRSAGSKEEALGLLSEANADRPDSPKGRDPRAHGRPLQISSGKTRRCDVLIQDQARNRETLTSWMWGLSRLRASLKGISRTGIR